MESIQPKLIRVQEVLDVQPFRIVCLWSNGEIRVNDLANDIARWQKSQNPYLDQLAKPDVFKTAFSSSGTIAFAGVLIDTGDMGLQPLDLDPDVLFDQSKKLEQPINEPVS